MTIIVIILIIVDVGAVSDIGVDFGGSSGAGGAGGAGSHNWSAFKAQSLKLFDITSRRPTQ
jgi:hypothetical protein